MSADSQAIQLAILIDPAAKSKKATEIIALDVSARLALMDIFILASGNNERRVRVVVEAVNETMSRHGARLTRREGFQECRWVLLGYDEIVVHVQHEFDRQFYALEGLWADAPVVLISDPSELVTAAPHANSEQASHKSTTVTARATQPISSLDFLVNKYRNEEGDGKYDENLVAVVPQSNRLQRCLAYPRSD